MDRAIATPTRATSTPKSATTGLHRDSTLTEAAGALADDLMRIPGIQRFGAMRLADLDSTGPRPLRTMWRIAREQVDAHQQELLRDLVDVIENANSQVDVKDSEFLHAPIWFSAYTYRDQVLGILGVVGPRRLPYPDVISAVDETARQVTEALARVRQDLYLPS